MILFHFDGNFTFQCFATKPLENFDWPVDAIHYAISTVSLANLNPQFAFLFVFLMYILDALKLCFSILMVFV